MHLTQGTFSHLPDLTDEEIVAQVAYAMDNGWAIALELTDDPHPRNVYWEMWGLPMFDAGDPSVVLHEIDRARSAHPGQYLRLVAYDASYGRQTTALSFIVNRPLEEPDLHLGRQEASGRTIRYSLLDGAAGARDALGDVRRP